MTTHEGLRGRKKARTRERIADVAAELFAAHGYEAVSVADVARAAEVSDQTVYNYFTAKHDLVLDRVGEFLERYHHVVVTRGSGTSPAQALRPVVAADIDRYRQADPRRARGEFPAQCVASPVLRRFALEFRERQTTTVADAIGETDPAVPRIVATAHAAALTWVVHTITDRIGASLLEGGPSAPVAADLDRDAGLALDDLHRAFGSILTTTSGDHP